MSNRPHVVSIRLTDTEAKALDGQRQEGESRSDAARRLLRYATTPRPAAGRNLPSEATITIHTNDPGTPAARYIPIPVDRYGRPW